MLQEGYYTKTIYTLLKNDQYRDVISNLEPVLQARARSTVASADVRAHIELDDQGLFVCSVFTFVPFEAGLQLSKRDLALPDNRAALSLLGYCYFYEGHYESACQTYEALVRHFPDNAEYRLYHAQSLLKSGDANEAGRIIDSMKDLPDRTTQLKMAIAYGSDQTAECRRVLRSCPPAEPETILNEGCLLYKEHEYTKARAKFQAALEVMGRKPSILYGIALCLYKEKQPGEALKYLAQIIERGVREHPELGVGTNAESSNARAIGNTHTLQETALIEAFNLKAAIEYRLKNLAAAKEALADMPPRQLEELDPVTLHNRALIHMDDDPEEGFNTLNFLISNPPFPAEAFPNLLLLYIKPPFRYHDLAADTIAEHPDYVQQYLSRDVIAFLDAANMTGDSPEAAYQQFEVLAKQHVERMRLLTKHIQEARSNNNTPLLQEKIQEYDDELELYIPVLMAQAHIYWEIGHYSQVMRVFNQSRDFASEHDTWKLNVAHTHFMMDPLPDRDGVSPQDNYQRAIKFYEPIVQRAKEKHKLLDITAMVVANLCVAYIMDSKNIQAEEVMKQLEQEEEQALQQDPTRQSNYEFGIGRVMKALEPLERKLETDTWHYAKRCFLALVEGMAKHMIPLNDKSFDDVLTFLDKVHAAGVGVPASFSSLEKTSKTVSYEARMLKRTLLKMRDA